MDDLRWVKGGIKFALGNASLGLLRRSNAWTLGVLMHEACPHWKKFFLRLHYGGAPFARVPDILIREGSEPVTK